MGLKLKPPSRDAVAKLDRVAGDEGLGVVRLERRQRSRGVVVAGGLTKDTFAADANAALRIGGRALPERDVSFLPAGFEAFVHGARSRVFHTFVRTNPLASPRLSLPVWS